MAVTLVGVGSVLAAHVPLSRDEFDPRQTASAEYWSRDQVLLGVHLNSRGARGMWRTEGELSPYFRSAFIALEDARFEQHDGIDWLAVARATRELVSLEPRSGASTITMQLARLLRPIARTPSGKVREMFLAKRLEATFSKDELLELYLNRVPLGKGIEGVEAASWAYFGHSAAHVSRAEALLIAALAPAPSRLDPRAHPRAACQAFARAAARAGEGELACPSVSVSNWPARARHFVDLVAQQLPQGGGRWRLSLDDGTQELTERVLMGHRQRLLLEGLEHAAAVVLDTRSGEVRALVGSFDYDDARSGQVNAALARRQAGSILKPFLYAMFVRGSTELQTKLLDVPRCFRSGDDVFCPQNCDGLYRGPVSARVALASSLNVPALEVQERVGLAAFSTKLLEAGLVTPPQLDGAGLGLALGDVDVRLLDVTRAFSALARAGRLTRPPLALGLPAQPELQLWAPEAAAAVLEALSDEDARRVGFGEAARLGLPRSVALKTGTSTFSRDLWALVASERWVIGVWLGNASGEATDAAAIEVAAPVAKQLIQTLIEAETTLSTGRR